MRFKAILALQEAAEAYLVGLFEAGAAMRGMNARGIQRDGPGRLGRGCVRMDLVQNGGVDDVLIEWSKRVQKGGRPESTTWFLPPKKSKDWNEKKRSGGGRATGLLRAAQQTAYGLRFMQD